ncbi:MAG: TIGR03936 family radical SAM-associated protein [Firmicutes bacterium]|nr:TIGR03936 family radical SAM-associated protein [Bacillota bacterium]
MLVVKFSKTLTAVYMSHLDLMRAINRTIKRAGYEPKFSQGHNPHALLKLSPPIPVGLSSTSEYFTLAIEATDKDKFLKDLNFSAPQGLEFLKVWETEKDPGLAREIIMAEYEISGLNSPLTVELPLGQKTVRVDNYIKEYNEKHGTFLSLKNAVKTKSFVMIGEKLVEPFTAYPQA